MKFTFACALILIATTALGRAQTVADLVETSVNDVIFWATANQTWDEQDPRICVYDPVGLNGGPLCKTNIGYYVHACGMTYDVIYAPDHAMNFYLRFQIKNACHGAVESDSVRGTYCAMWGEDWSRYPLAPYPHKFNVASLCSTTYTNGDPAQPALGCKNNFAPYSQESDAEWLQWKACQNPNDQAGTVACEAAQFAWQTGWNWTVLAQMTDLVLQNGNDCQKWFEGRQGSFSADVWPQLCEAGDVPAPPTHQVLLALQAYKNFTATWARPYNAKVSFSPSPPSPPNPPPSPPSPPSPPPSPNPPPGPPLLLQNGALNSPSGAPGLGGSLPVSAAPSAAPAAALAALALAALLV